MTRQQSAWIATMRAYILRARLLRLRLRWAGRPAGDR